jgi:hypothetical protein
MHFIQAIYVGAALASTALAAPTMFMTVTAEEWTIESVKRDCGDDDKSCVWNFSINTHAADAEPTAVKYVVNATDAAPASRATGGPSEFGVFTVTSTWSDYFGEEEAWTTLSVIDYDRGVLVYPAYKDKQLADGATVEPDQSYTPENLPA